MTIQYNNELTLQQYREQRYLALLWLEEDGHASTTLYRDSSGYATIGVGFKVDSNWRTILNAFGIIFDNPSTAEQGYIHQIQSLFYIDGDPTHAYDSNVKRFTEDEIDTLQDDLKEPWVRP